MRQPLTRLDCVAAGMQWRDQSNVCGDPAEAAIQAVTSPASVVLINIDKASQRMIVLLDGAEQYNWPVSTGLRGYLTPSGTYAASSMHEMWVSKEWDDAPMPHAVFFTKDGHAIHGTNEVERLGKPASHGCVRLSQKNAAILYSLVAKNGLAHTQIELVGTTPGGESKVAKSRSESRVSSSTRSKPRYPAESYDEPQRQRGVLGACLDVARFGSTRSFAIRRTSGSSAPRCPASYVPAKAKFEPRSTVLACLDLVETEIAEARLE